MNQDINEHILKIIGTANISEPLLLNHDYLFGIEGSVEEVSDRSTHDGAIDRTYKLRATIVKILNEKGETIKSVDIRKNSQKLRAMTYHYWNELDISTDFEDFYDGFMKKLMANFGGVVDYMKSVK